MTEQEWRDQLLKQVNSIHQGLYGVPGTDDKGLVGDFKFRCEQMDDQARQINKLKNRVTALIALLVGSGVLGGGAIVNSLLGG